MEQGIFRPIVKWAQRADRILLRVDIKRLRSREVLIDTNTITFRARGVGYAGLQSYAFIIDLYDEIDAENSHHVVRVDHIDIACFKEVRQWWPQLVPCSEINWIEIDQRRWVEPTSDDSEVTTDSESDCETYDSLPRKEVIVENISPVIPYHSTSFNDEVRTLFCFTYSMLQVAVCGIITIFLGFGGAFNSATLFPNTFAIFSRYILISNVFGFVESLHKFTFLNQMSGLRSMCYVGQRLSMLAFISISSLKLKQSLLIYDMFICWMLSDTVRYSFNMFASLYYHVEVLLWLRYSLFILINPFILLFEFMYVISFIFNTYRQIVITEYEVDPKIYLLLLYMIFTIFFHIFIFMRQYRNRLQKIEDAQTRFSKFR